MRGFLAKKMHYFMVTMEERNFSKAAEKLCITRSPLSKVICELEDMLGGKLFRRTYTSLEPTELAIEYHHKCKNVYDALLHLESEIHNREASQPLSLVFDASVPELLYRAIVLGLSVENIKTEHRRDLVNCDDISDILNNQRSVIISLREINDRRWDCVDKWQGEDMVLLVPGNSENAAASLPVFIWKDNLTEYLKRSYAALLGKPVETLQFIPHNHDLTALCYHVHAGCGCAFMTRKLACLYKTDGVKVRALDNGRVNVFLYHEKKSGQAKKIAKIKSVINKFL